MSLLFDQNLSRHLPGLLVAEFPGAEQVIAAGLAAADDLEVWDYAKARCLTIVSKDADFALLSSKYGPPPKVILLRIGNGPTRDALSLLRSRVNTVRAFLADPVAALLELP